MNPEEIAANLDPEAFRDLQMVSHFPIEERSPSYSAHLSELVLLGLVVWKPSRARRWKRVAHATELGRKVSLVSIPGKLAGVRTYIHD